MFFGERGGVSEQKLSKGNRMELFPFPSGKYDKAIAQRQGRINRLKWKGRPAQIRGLIHLPDNLAGEDWQPTNHCCTCFTWLSNERGAASTPVCSTTCCKSPPSLFRSYKGANASNRQWTVDLFTLNHQIWLNESGRFRSLLSKVLNSRK